MKKPKKILSGILALAVVFSFAGCGDKKATENNTDDITLKWVMPGPGKQTDSDIVWEKFNEELKKQENLENVTVEFEIIPPADYAQKFLLMQTGGEQMDIVGTFALDYATEVKNKTFLDITDMMDEYAPDIKKEIPEWALKLTQIGNRQYTITNYQQMSMPMWGYIFNQDDADTYLDYEECENEFLSNDILTEKTLDIFEKYLDDLNAAGKLNLGMRPGTTWAVKGYVDIWGPYLYRVETDKVVVENRLQLDTMKMLIERFSEWYKKGYIRKDILSAEVNVGEYDINHAQWHKYAESGANIQTPDKPVRILKSSQNFYIPNSSNSGGNGVLTVSKNPQKALRLLNLMYTSKGKDLYRLLVYGIEGEHYTKISEDRFEAIGYVGGQGTSDAPYGLWKWIVGNTANAYESPSDPEGWNDYVFNDWNANAIPSKIAGITIDTTAIDTELNQCSGVVGEYQDQLASGALDDWEAVYAEAMRKLEVAGNDKVIAELQRQVDEYLASQK